MGNSSSTCPLPDGAGNYQHDSARKTMLLFAGACTGATLLISLSLIISHLRRYRCPKEQKQIIRLILAPSVFAVVSFLAILSYEVGPYIAPIGDLYEAFGLCALFLLYLQYAAPGGTFDEETFQQVKMAEEGKTSNTDWPRITWILVFQYPILEFIAVVICEVTEAQGVYCVQSLSPHFGHLWVQILSCIGVMVCLLALIRFYGRMKKQIKVRRGLAKLVCIKLIVFLRFVQSLAFSILLDHNVIKPGTTFSYNDILYGLENAIICGEMALLSASFWYAYSSTEYGTNAKPLDLALPMWHGVLDVINPWDLLEGIGHWVTIVLNLRKSAGNRSTRLQESRGQCRYQTVDGTESLSLPGAAYGRTGPQFESTSYPMQSGTGQHLYQPPSGSPPSYDHHSTHLTAGPGRDDGWNGQKYNRSPSPGGRFAEGRDMV